MKRRRRGFVDPSRPIEILPCVISFTLRSWQTSAEWMKRGPSSRRGWLSIPGSPSRIFNRRYRVTIPSILSSGPGSLSICAEPMSPTHERRGLALLESAGLSGRRVQIQREDLFRLLDAAQTHLFRISCNSYTIVVTITNIRNKTYAKTARWIRWIGLRKGRYAVRLGIVSDLRQTAVSI